MLKVTNIQKTFNGNHVLKGIDFEIKKGEVVAILGPSGSGKTTFLRCLNLLERPEQGVLEFTDGSLKIDFSKKISKAEELNLRRRSSMVFQQYNLFPHRTAVENVMEGMVVVQKQSKELAREKALALLEKVGLKALKLLAQEGWTMIIVTHEMQFAKDVADRVILMADGYVVEQNAADKFFTCPQQERTKQFLLQAKMPFEPEFCI